MKYTNEQLNSLRLSVSKLLSKKRFLHTLGVEKTASFIGEKMMPDKVSELRAAALLHDISKEYSEAEYFSLFKSEGIQLSNEDLQTPSIWHSLSAPGVIKKSFPSFDEPSIISAVYNHTVGSSDMTLFDEIIFLSDYIEEGRKYESCIKVRSAFISFLEKNDNENQLILVLHEASLQALQNTILELASRNKHCHTRTLETRDALLLKTERLKMEIKKEITINDSTALAREAVKVLLEKKALDVKLFDVRGKSGITDYYINATGRSNTQVASLADDVDEKMSENGRSALRTEGKRGNGWILVDFGDVIINVFDRASREFYNLDKHFSDEASVDISDLVEEVDKKFDINTN